MPKSDLVRLRDILEHVREAAALGQSGSFKDFEENRLLALAAARLMEIAGEAASQVTGPTRSRHPAIPWAKLVGLRNRLIHAYREVNLEILWETITTDLPPLVAGLEDVIRREEAVGQG